MRPLLALPALLVAILAGSAAPAAAAADCPAADEELTSANGARVRDAVVCLTNHARSVRGLAPLARSGALDAAAQGHTNDMIARDYFDHETPEGLGPGDRAVAAGFAGRFVGENIAGGYETARETVQQWMESAGHCRNILGTGYTAIGVGAGLGGEYRTSWTQNFGRPTGATAPPTSPLAILSCPANIELGSGTAPLRRPPPGPPPPPTQVTPRTPSLAVTRLALSGRRLAVTVAIRRGAGSLAVTASNGRRTVRLWRTRTGSRTYAATLARGRWVARVRLRGATGWRDASWTSRRLVVR